MNSYAGLAVTQSGVVDFGGLFEDDYSGLTARQKRRRARLAARKKKAGRKLKRGRRKLKRSGRKARKGLAAQARKSRADRQRARRAALAKVKNLKLLKRLKKGGGVSGRLLAKKHQLRMKRAKAIKKRLLKSKLLKKRFSLRERGRMLKKLKGLSPRKRRIAMKAMAASQATSSGVSPATTFEASEYSDDNGYTDQSGAMDITAGGGVSRYRGDYPSASDDYSMDYPSASGVGEEFEPSTEEDALDAYEDEEEEEGTSPVMMVLGAAAIGGLGYLGYKQYQKRKAAAGAPA